MLAPIAAIVLVQKTGPAEWGAEAIAMIRRDYYLPRSKLYAERPDKKQPAFNWGVGVMLSALNAAAKFDPKYKPWLREFADASRIYWNKGGYDVLPAPKPLDRYYDDNAWMALALVETHEILGDKKYLDWARGALKFTLSGESKNGGIFWREKDRASRNTCSCAPTAAACLAVFRHTKDSKLIDAAKRIVKWTKEHLEDPADGLYWDNVSNSGNIDKTKWTYNTALMIRSKKSLDEHSRRLSEASPSSELDRMMKSSKTRWLRDGKIHDPGRFAHLLLENWIAIDGPKSEYREALGHVRAARSPEGHHPADWGELKVAKNPEILDQASFVRTCFAFANADKKSCSSR